MMQSAAATPDNWSSITNQSNQQAQAPTEYLGSGRTNNIPTYSKDGEQWQKMDSNAWQQLQSSNPYGGVDSNLAADYTDPTGNKFYKQSSLDNSYAHIVSGSPGKLRDANFQDPTNITKGGYYYSDPWGYAHQLQKMGSSTYFAPEFQNQRSGTADLSYGVKDPANIYRYNNNGQLGYLFDSNKTNFSNALAGGRNNTAFAEKGSGGILGTLNKITEKFDPIGNFVTNTDAKNAGFDNRLDMVSTIGEPVGNILGAVFSGGIPWGSIAMAGQNASTGNWDAVGNNALNGLLSYAGTNMNIGGVGGAPVDTAVGASGAAANSMAGSAGGIFGSGVNLGSTAANQAFQNMALSAGKNYITNGGNIGNALRSAAFSGAAGAAGNWLGDATRTPLGEIGSKALGGAASGGLNSLFAGNSPVNGSLYGAMSGGLHGFLNSTDRSNNTYNQKQNLDNRNIAQTTTNLAKLFAKK
jgi:hypothetical protein